MTKITAPQSCRNAVSTFFLMMPAPKSRRKRRADGPGVDLLARRAECKKYYRSLVSEDGSRERETSCRNEIYAGLESPSLLYTSTSSSSSSAECSARPPPPRVRGGIKALKYESELSEDRRRGERRASIVVLHKKAAAAVSGPEKEFRQLLTRLLCC